MIISAMKDGSANEINRLIGVPEGVEQVTLSEINLPLIPPKPIKKERADLNNDDRVNIIDFSILLYYWGSLVYYKPYNSKADLNDDGAINLHDISLMFSHWTN